MSTLSTHVLDTMHGCPARGVKLRLETGAGEILFTGMTDADGRCSGIRTLEPGPYAIIFEVADYFRAKGVVLPNPPFLDQIPILFGIADELTHYHVPLLVSPFAYSTYRGS